MTREEAIKTLKENYCAICAYGSQNMDSCDIRSCDNKDAIKALEQEPCEDVVSRQAAIVALDNRMSSLENVDMQIAMGFAKGIIHELPSVTPQPKMGHCKDCKYFEYDSVAKVNGIPLIVAHEICKRWGDGCKSKEDGYCFLFEPKM